MNIKAVEVFTLEQFCEKTKASLNEYEKRWSEVKLIISDKETCFTMKQWMAAFANFVEKENESRFVETEDENRT